MMDVLAQIVGKKRERLEAAKSIVSLADVRHQALATRRNAEPHALRRALSSNGINIIAEFKRRSPSKGVICDAADLLSVVRSYEAGGAAAISVLTEEDYFDGSLEDLRDVKRSVALPVLRKDFVLDEYQVFEAAGAGADALLLIVAVLDDGQLARLRRLTEDELDMDALVEVHDAEEMERAVACGAKIIGVNNRDLRTFAVTLDTSLRLARVAPDDVLLVSESGFSEGSELRRLRDERFDGFLIGETLMRALDPAQALRDLRNDAR